MESKPGFIPQTDLTTSVGSVLQTIRFPEMWDPDEDETLYYANTINPNFEKLAPALRLGYE